MEYFELTQSSTVENPLTIMKLDSNEYNYRMQDSDFQALERLKVAYFSGREFEEICDILTEPTYLVSDLLRKTLELYDKRIEFKGVQLFPTAEESKTYPLYWVPKFLVRNCIHADTEKFDNGMLKKLILDEKKIAGCSIFRIGEIQEYKVAVSLPVAESIMRRRLYGVCLKRIEVR